MSLALAGGLLLLALIAELLPGHLGLRVALAMTTGADMPPGGAPTMPSAVPVAAADGAAAWWQLTDGRRNERAALAEAGIRAFEHGDPDQAAVLWRQLAATLPPDSPAARDLDAAAREARRRARQIDYGAPDAL